MQNFIAGTILKRLKTQFYFIQTRPHIVYIYFSTINEEETFRNWQDLNLDHQDWINPLAYG